MDREELADALWFNHGILEKWGWKWETWRIFCQIFTLNVPKHQKFSEKHAYLADFPPKTHQKSTGIWQGWSQKGICDSDICPKSGKFLSIHCNVTKFGGSIVFNAQILPDIRQIPSSFWPISGKFPHVSCNIMTHASWLICYEIWQISGKFPALKSCLISDL